MGWGERNATERHGVEPSGTDGEAARDDDGERARERARPGWSRLNRDDAALAVVVLAGLAWRLWYIWRHSAEPFTGDGEDYHFAANLLSDGHGFIAPVPFVLSFGQVTIPAADHPPLWTITLALGSLLGVTTFFGHQVMAALIGSATVGMVGVAGRQIGGTRVGLLAAALAAAYPNLWMYERVLLSETLAILLTAVMVYLAYRFWSRPGPRGALALGLVTGLLALTRAEAVLLIFVVVVPLIWCCSESERRTRAAWLGLAVGVTVITIAPWAVYNSARFENPVILTTNFGQTLASANCPQVYEGPQIGWWSYECLVAARDAATEDGGDVSNQDIAMRSRAVDFARDHASQLPRVVLAREGRTWGVFQPLYQTRLDAVGGPSQRPTRWGLWMYWFLAVGAVAGGVILRRRRVPLYPVVAFMLTVAVAAGLTIGQTRYRALAEVSIVLLAAVAIDACCQAWTQRKAREKRIGDPTDGTPEPAPAMTAR